MKKKTWTKLWKRKESDIKRAILQYLKAKGHFVFIVSTVGIYDSKIGHRRRAPMRGVSDIIGLTDKGRFIAIEVKRGGSGTTFEQEQFLHEVEDRGGIAYVASSLDDIIEAGL